MAKTNFELLNIPLGEQLVRDSGGSTDFGNVSGIVPGILIYLPYLDAPGHTDEWVAAGKTDHARNCLLTSTQMLATVMHDLVLNPEIIRKAKEEFDKK